MHPFVRNIRAVLSFQETKDKLHTCHCSNLGMTDVTSERVGYFTGVPSRCVLATFTKTLHNTGVSNDLCVVFVVGVELLSVLIPCDKQLWRSLECALQSEFLTQREAHILQLLDKASRF